MRMIEIGQIRTECKALSFSPSEEGGGELRKTKGGGGGVGWGGVGWGGGASKWKTSIKRW